MSEKNVHSGHRRRLRDRAQANGLDSFDPHQILELLLFYAIHRQDTSTTAHLLIDRFGSVYSVLTAPEEELLQVPGVGKRVAEWLLDVGRLVTTYGELKPDDRPKIENLQSVNRFCKANMEKCADPQTYYLCLTPTGVIQACSLLCNSLSWGEPAVLRRCLDEVLRANSRNVMVIQFIDVPHPVPEQYDIVHAANYAYTLRAVGAELLDVILVGSEEIVSMVQRGDYDRSLFGEPRSILSEAYLREVDLSDCTLSNLPLTDEDL